MAEGDTEGLWGMMESAVEYVLSFFFRSILSARSHRCLILGFSFLLSNLLSSFADAVYLLL